MGILKRVIYLILLIGLSSSVTYGSSQQPSLLIDTSDFAQFESELDSIRQALHIPGMAAGIVHNQELVWANGFGYADVEKGIPVTADTPFHLASVTKPIAATLLMQLVEEEALALSDPVHAFGVNLPNPDITVWHLLTHSSEGVPGTTHNYNGNRYAELSHVISAAGGSAFGHQLTERFIVPLEMTHTAPNPTWYGASWAGYMASLGVGKTGRQFSNVYRHMARPYQLDERYNNIAGSYPLPFQPAAGLIGSVTDLARFDIALDNNLLVKPETKAQMFSPAISNSGQPMIYGLGWYTQEFNGTQLIWHSGGWTPSVSALLVKVPQENLTFIALANNHNMTRPYPFDSGDVLYSTPALLFYERFVFPQVTGKEVPMINWDGNYSQLVTQLRQVTDPEIRQFLERELWSYRKLYASVGEKEMVDRLLLVHETVFGNTLATYSSIYTVGVNDSIPEPTSVTLLPEQIVVANRLTAIWSLLTGAALLMLFISIRRQPALSAPQRVMWLAITLMFGWFGTGAYWFIDRPGKQTATQLWQKALRAAMFSVTGNMIGFALVLVIIMTYLPSIPGAVPAILGMILVGWLFFRTPLAAWTSGQSYWRMLPKTLLAELGSTLFVCLGAFPVAVYMMNTLMREAAVTPLFLLVVIGAALPAVVTIYPFTIWHRQRSRNELKLRTIQKPHPQ